MGGVLQCELDFLTHVLLGELDVLCEISEGGAEAIEVHGEFFPLTFAHTDEQMVVVSQCRFGVIDSLFNDDVSAVCLAEVNLRAYKVSLAGLILLVAVAVEVLISRNDGAIACV